MATVSSNLEEIAAKMTAVVDSFNFTAVGRGNKRLGDEALDVVANGIAARTLQRQQEPGGAHMEDNQGDYGKRKQKKGIPVGVGFYPVTEQGQTKEIGGQMLSDIELSGERVIEEQTATMTYGKDGYAKRKAQWFTNGSTGTDGEKSGAKNQPPRPFYELDDGITTDLDANMTAEFKNYMSHVRK
jgi:hypothetical protein